MEQAQLNWLTNFIWNIADDVLRDVYVCGKYRDVILPMTVLRRLDAVLEPTKQDVLEMKVALDREGVTNQDDALRAASGQAFYNTSPFLLRDLKSRSTQQKLRDDFEAYLDGYSPNVQDILTNFEFRNQIPRLSKADALGQLIEKFLDKDVNISPHAVGDLPRLDNHSMGTLFEELVRRFNEQSKIFPNAAFGYWKVKVERPLRLRSQLARPRIETLRYASGDAEIRAELYAQLGDDLFEKPTAVRQTLAKLINDWGEDELSDDDENGEGSPKKGLPDRTKKRLLDPDTWKRDAGLFATAEKLREALGEGLFEDHNVFLEQVEATLKKQNLKLSAADRKLIVNAVSWRDEASPPVIKKVHKPGKAKPDPLHGLYASPAGNSKLVLEYEPDSELRDFEQIPLLEEGGIEAFIRREVLPYTPDAWIVQADTKIGYEVSFTRHFYQPPKLRTLAEISADILALEQETEGLLSEITKGTVNS